MSDPVEELKKVEEELAHQKITFYYRALAFQLQFPDGLSSKYMLLDDYNSLFIHAKKVRLRKKNLTSSLSLTNALSGVELMLVKFRNYRFWKESELITLEVNLAYKKMRLDDSDLYRFMDYPTLHKDRTPEAKNLETTIRRIARNLDYTFKVTKGYSGRSGRSVLYRNE